ncbi:unnamed protein product, partial [Closterium sp. NIES-54]
AHQLREPHSDCVRAEQATHAAAARTVAVKYQQGLQTKQHPEAQHPQTPHPPTQDPQSQHPQAQHPQTHHPQTPHPPAPHPQTQHPQTQHLEQHLRRQLPDQA